MSLTNLLKSARIAMVLGTVVLPAIDSPAQASSQCGYRDSVLRNFWNKFNEHPVAVGIVPLRKSLLGSEGALEIMVSERGSWTIQFSSLDGKISCNYLVGTDWEFKNMDPKDDVAKGIPVLFDTTGGFKTERPNSASTQNETCYSVAYFSKALQENGAVLVASGKMEGDEAVRIYSFPSGKFILYTISEKEMCQKFEGSAFKRLARRKHVEDGWKLLQSDQRPYIAGTDQYDALAENEKESQWAFIF